MAQENATIENKEFTLGEEGISFTIRVHSHPTEVLAIELSSSLPADVPVPLQILEMVTGVLQRQLAINYNTIALVQFQGEMQKQAMAQQEAALKQQRTGLVVPGRVPVQR